MEGVTCIYTYTSRGVCSDVHILRRQRPRSRGLQACRYGPIHTRMDTQHTQILKERDSRKGRIAVGVRKREN